jgi:hypothetical protein
MSGWRSVMKNPRCRVPQILQAAGPIFSIHLYMLMYRRLVWGPFEIKHKAASDKVVANFKPCRVSDRPYVLRPRGLMPHSPEEGSSPVAIHPTYPNLLRSSILNIGLARLPSRRGLSTFVLGLISPASCCVTLEGSLPYASSFLPALCRAQVGLLANHSLGAHDRFRWTLNVSPCCSIYPKAFRSKPKNSSFLPGGGRRLCRTRIVDSHAEAVNGDGS